MRKTSVLWLVGLCFMCFWSVCSAGGMQGKGDLIMGAPVATKEQCLKYLLRINPEPALTVPPRKLIDQYYEEGAREGVRADIAFAQALKETGFFRYGGLVKPNQNNFCGLGSMGKHAKGAWFRSSQLGVRAHIQHILVYSSTRMPRTGIVDPRYMVVKGTRNFGRAATWNDLNGKWAVPGYGYGQGILNIYREILSVD